MNERLPALRAKDIIAALERAGFVKSRISGSHCRVIHSGDSTRKITIPIHAKDLKRGTLRASLRSQG